MVNCIKEGQVIELDGGIEKDTPTEELKAEIESVQGYQDCIITWKTRVSLLIQKGQEEESVRRRESNGSANSDQSLSRPTVKLPRLVIDKFHGEISQWQEYRFGRKDIVVSAHMSKLLTLTPVKKSSDIAALRSLYDECEIPIRSLESLGVHSDTYGSLLCHLLLQLIPDDLALGYTRTLDADGEWKVPELIKFLQNEVQSRERALQLTRSGSSQ